MDHLDRELCTIAAIRAVRDNHSAVMLTWINSDDTQLMDATTASMFIKVFEALRPSAQMILEDRIQIGQVQLLKAVSMCWKAIK